MALSLPGVYKLAIQGRCAGQQIVTVHHVRKAVGAVNVGADLAAIVTTWTINNGPLAAYLGCHNADYTLENVTAYEMTVGGQQYSQTFNNSPGTLFGSTGSLTAACVITWKTPYGGRARRGRTFIGPLSSIHVQSGIVQIAAVNAISVYAGELLAQFSSASASYAFQLVVASDPGRKLTNKPKLPDIYPNPSTTDIVTFLVRNIARSQRRREIGVGG